MGAPERSPCLLPSHVPQLGHLSALASLTISGSPMGGEELDAALHGLTSLQRLSLQYCSCLPTRLPPNLITLTLDEAGQQLLAAEAAAAIDVALQPLEALQELTIWLSYEQQQQREWAVQHAAWQAAHEQREAAAGLPPVGDPALAALGAHTLADVVEMEERRGPPPPQLATLTAPRLPAAGAARPDAPQQCTVSHVLTNFTQTVIVVT